MLNRKFYSVLSLMAILVSCSSNQDKNLDKEIAATPSVSSHAEADKNVKATIEGSTHLTDAQKTQLLDLHANTDREVAKLNQETLKLHEILATEYGQAETSMKEIRSIKKRMVKNSKKRLEIIFGAMDQADKILGHNENTKNVGLMNSLFLEQIDHRK